MRAGRVSVGLSLLAAVFNVYTPLQILPVVLEQAIAAFGVTGDGAAERFYARKSAISFMDGVSAQNLHLGPGEERLSVALAEMAKH